MHGYSSSEESDDPRRPKPQVNNNNNKNDNDQKKKKKPKLPPQATINHIWKTFQKRKPSKALAVLPFDPVPPLAGSDRPNELMSVGYERAAEECRRKVKKIIQECRRVNTRYRDPGWDLDWDLKREKGQCLNSLGSTKWSVSRSSLANPNATVPKAVKRVHEIFEKPTFMKNPSSNDVKQGSLGNCWLIACLTALANVPGALQKICVEYDTRIGIYGFVFFRDGEWIYSIIDDKLYLKSPAWDSRSVQRDLLQQIDCEDQERVYRKTYQTGSKALFFGKNKDQNETWLPLLEKAYAKAHGDYACLSGGWTGEALEDLTGGVTTEMLVSDILDLEGFWENELSRVNEEFMFGCSTGLLECGYGDRDGISEGHAYVLMDAKTLKSGERLLKLRNPWGKTRKGLWEGAWSDGSKEWTPDAVEELGHQFGNDSSFWISYEDFLNKFQHFDRTRLFSGSPWQCSQRWIGVEVPWKSQYHEKFRFKLTKDSPLVLALSQLDVRYFKGLDGQYSFLLHFRVHEKDHPDAEDYFVRSHGNYLMDRSIAIEIPDMPAGEYSVFVSVTAERDLSKPSVEDVVKRECKERVENEKLSQVGYAYDLAHSKGTAYLEEVARLRKTKEQERASGLRQKERRKLWDRRHRNRQITRKQKEKNREKKERREARLAEERGPEEEHTPKDQSCQTEDLGEKKGDNKAEVQAADDASDSSESKDNDTPKKDEAAPKDEDKEDKGNTEKKARLSRPSRSSSPKKKAPRKKRIAETDGDSSDSPIEDWDDLYSDDDMTRKPRTAPVQPPLPKSAIYESEPEDAPEPWNAICILGVRVYSQDEHLELNVVMEEGGHLMDGGPGRKGEADIDNAQANAGGVREKETEREAPVNNVGGTVTAADPVVEGEKMNEVTPEELKLDETTSPPHEQQQQPQQQQAAADASEASKEGPSEGSSADSMEDSKSDQSNDSSESDKLDSGATTPGVLVAQPSRSDTAKQLA